MTTTIKLQEQTKEQLDIFREYRNESYDDILRKILFIVKSVKKQPKLSQKTIKDIEAARKRISNGEYYTLTEAEKILGYKKR
ncbi:hypothetical protein C4573_05845 [Candidatus Woesearchaeota archaeon]|nr:MAG: hypothetical protein C4573_05845 [Candidatus Woesearchaeota archaeon]